MPEKIHDKQLSAKLDALFDVGRDFAQGLLARVLESLQAGDQGEASTRSGERETAPAPETKSVLTLAELAALLRRDPKTIKKWVEDFGMPELRADADKSEPLYYWPEVLEFMHRHQKNNGKIPALQSNGTRPQAKLR